VAGPGRRPFFTHFFTSSRTSATEDSLLGAPRHQLCPRTLARLSVEQSTSIHSHRALPRPWRREPGTLLSPREHTKCDPRV